MIDPPLFSMSAHAVIPASHPPQLGKFNIKWADFGYLPTQPANPAYPTGIDLDVAGVTEFACYTRLPYQLPRCGQIVLDCLICGLHAVITNAGRPDDPRSIRLPCKSMVRA